MRYTTLLLLATLTGAVVAASACTERFPLPNPSADAMDAGDAAPSPLEGRPPAAVAAEKRRDASSSPVVFDAERGGVWTANGDVGTVSYVDVDARALVQEIAVGKDVTGLALSPDARFVAAVDRAGGTVTFVDAETRAVKRVLAVGGHPRAAVWDAANPRWLYVALEDDGAVAIVDRTETRVVRTVAVGRLPSGVAVSRLRNELYVTHRIDGRVTVVPLDGDASPADKGAAHAEIDLAVEQGNGDPKVPHGKPFALESLAFAPDGITAWVPHELLAPTHPFQFQSTIFPAVSVVDLARRTEVPTDDASGVTAGRKNLFAAINIIDGTGNTTIVSQPCAAALHPAGFTGYALACGSEDLITFDMLTGAAIDLLRGLPGDHPSGLALDDTGQRAFVLADQSKELVVVDLAGGSVIKHARVVGAPIKIAKDTAPPALRAGLKLFYSANSAKGALAATGNFWMACASCHLDGFGATNLGLIESAQIADPTADAQIGHVGLKDLFSTSPTPDDPSFQPHDVLVAFADQGGLAPDRTGAHRDGAVDPAAPTPDARAMAQSVARVIARDLPLGPSWLMPGAKLDAAYLEDDAESCGNCHAAEYAAWKQSVHAHSGKDPMVTFGAGIEAQKLGPQYVRLCAGCHDPVSARAGDVTMTSGRGVTCVGCHDTERLIHAGGNGDLDVRAHDDWQKDHKARAKKGLETLRDPRFCGGCHQQFVPGTALEAISTLHEWQRSAYAGQDGDLGHGAVTGCIDCHAPKDTRGIADHAMIGGNVYMARAFSDDATVKAAQASLTRAVTMRASRVSDVVLVTLKNRGAGHAFPTGVSDVREPWVELQAIDAGGHVVARYGGPDANGVLPPDAARLGMDIASKDGTLLLLHELSETTRLTFDRRIPAGGEVDLTVKRPEPLPPGAVKLDAVLLYRNVRAVYFKRASAAGTPLLEAVEVTRATVP